MNFFDEKLHSIYNYVFYLFLFFSYILIAYCLLFIFQNYFIDRINELLAALHNLRYNKNKNKNDNSEEKNEIFVTRQKHHFADLSKRLLSENIPLDSSSTAIIEYLLSNLRKDEERAVELGKGL